MSSSQDTSHNVDFDEYLYDEPPCASFSINADGYSSASEMQSSQSGGRKVGRRMESVTAMSGADDALSCRQVGVQGTLTWRAEFFASGGRLSPVDDVPTFLALRGIGDEFVHCVCTTPAGQWIRTEVADEPFHPLRVSFNTPRCCTNEEASSMPAYPKSTGSAGAVRRSVSFEDEHVRPAESVPAVNKSSLTSAMKTKRNMYGNSPLRIHPEGGGTEGRSPQHYADNAPWNLGFIPQTTVAQLAIDVKRDGLRVVPENARVNGSSSPFEVIEIGAERPRSVGETYLVRPLGAFLVSNGGVLTWSVVAIADSDPMSKFLGGEADMRKWLPGNLEHIREWLRRCQCVHDGEHKAKILLMEQVADVDATRLAIFRAHLAWQTRRRRTDAGALGTIKAHVEGAATGSQTSPSSATPPLPSPPKMLLPPLSVDTTTRKPSSSRSTSMPPLPSTGSVLEEVRIPLANPSSATLFDSSWALAPKESQSSVGATSDKRNRETASKGGRRQSRSNPVVESAGGEEWRESADDMADSNAKDTVNVGMGRLDREAGEVGESFGAELMREAQTDGASEEDLLSLLEEEARWQARRQFRRSFSSKEPRSSNRGSGLSGRFNVSGVASLIPRPFRRGTNDKVGNVLVRDGPNESLTKDDRGCDHESPSFSKKWSSRFGMMARDVASTEKLGGQARFRKGDQRRLSRNNASMSPHSAPEMSAEDKELTRAGLDEIFDLPPSPRTIELELACKKDAMRRLQSALNVIHSEDGVGGDKDQTQVE